MKRDKMGRVLWADEFALVECKWKSKRGKKRFESSHDYGRYQAELVASANS